MARMHQAAASSTAPAVSASVPSGASTGVHEAWELRDTDQTKVFLGKGVMQAVDNVMGLARVLLVCT